MYAEQSTKLVQDAKRIQSLAHLPPYAATTVRAANKEIRDLDREVSNLLAPYGSQSSQGTQFKSSFSPAEDPATACALLVSHLSMRRNKRNLLSYHRVRTEKIEGLIWNGTDVSDLQNQAVITSAANGTRQSTTASSLSAEEEQYAHGFNELLAAYKGQWSDIDLTGSLEPPKDLWIDVRVIKDAGTVETEYGSLTLSKNSQFYVRQSDVQQLLQQGYLQRLS